MEKIQAGKYVELVYEIFVVNGDQQTSVFKFNKEHPDAFVFGMDLSLIEGFQNHIMGLEQGEKFDFTPGKVSTMLHRTRKKLQDYLKEEGLC